MRTSYVLVCLLSLAACGEVNEAPPKAAIPAAVAIEAEEPEPPPTIDSLIDSVPPDAREPLFHLAVAKVAKENRADWMLTESAGSVAMWQHAVAIFNSGKQGLTFQSLIKEAYQSTREDFLNRAEVAKTTADMLARAEIDAARSRENNRMLREQQMFVQRRYEERQAAFQAEVHSSIQAQRQREAAYAPDSRQFAQPATPEPAMRTAANPSRYDPEKVGWDPRKGYTAPRYSSRATSDEELVEGGGAAQTQSGPTRFQDQNGNWYQQPPGSSFARNERTGQQCFVFGNNVKCK